MLKIFIKSVLFITITGAISAMSPVQLQNLKAQFDQALRGQQFDQAQQMINQLPAGQRGAYAPQWQSLLDAAKGNAQAARKQQEEAQRFAEEQRKKNEEEARRRADQARIEAEKRAYAEKQLKDAAEKERAAGRDYSGQLLQQIQARDAQLKAQTEELNRARYEQAQLKLNYDSINRVIASRDQELKNMNEAYRKLQEALDLQSQTFEKYKKACQEQQASAKGVVQPAAAPVVSAPSAQANQELRTRLAEVEKANAALREQIAQSEKVNVALRDQLTQAEKQRSAQAAAAAQELKRGQDQIEIFRKESQQMAEQVKEIQVANQNYERLFKEHAAQELKAASAQEKFAYQQALQKELKPVQDRANAAEQQLLRAQKELQDYKDRVEPGLRKQIDEQQKRIEQLKPSAAEQAERIAIKKMHDQLLNANQKLEKTVRDLTDTLEKANKELKMANEANTYLEKQIDEKDNEIFVMDADLGGAQAAVKKLTAEREALQKQLDEARSAGDKSCKDLETKLKTAKDAGDAFREEANELQQANDKLTQQNQELLNGYKQYKEIADELSKNLKNELAEKEAYKKRYKQDYEKVFTEKEELNDQVEESIKTIKAITKDNENLKDEVELSKTLISRLINDLQGNKESPANALRRLQGMLDTLNIAAGIGASRVTNAP